MIIQVGPFPPPYGGISVYIKRMKLYLDALKINNKVWCTSEDSAVAGIEKVRIRYLPIKLIFNKDVDIIHYNITGVKSKIYIGLFNKIFFRKKKKLLSIHGDSKELFLKYNFWIIKALNSFDTLICVKKGDKEFLMDKGIKRTVFEIPAYLNPIEDENDIKNIPGNVWDFIYNSQFLISANSWVRFYNNEDLYGIDMLIELIKKLILNGYDADLFIALLGCESQNEEEKKHYKQLKNTILNYELSNKIFIFEVKDTEFYPVLKKSKLFLRPTNTDGDAVSIREALHYKVPSIASDVIPRPEGTVLFKTRDTDDLYNKTVDIIANYDLYKDKLKDIKQGNNAEKLLNIYKEL